MLVDLTLPGSGKMVALEQRQDRQVLSDRAEIIIELSHSCKLHFVHYQEAFHAFCIYALHQECMCRTQIHNVISQ